jgi:putative transposase
MPVDKQQHTTLTPIPTTAESSSAQGVVQQSFHQQLRDHIRAAVQVVMEEIMRDELTQFVGAQWGESTSARKGYSNGSYRRDLATSSGQIQDLKVPRDREGKFHTQLFDRYSRYEEQVAEGVTQMFGSRDQHPQSRRSGSNAPGSRAQRKSRQSAQSHFDRTI